MITVDVKGLLIGVLLIALIVLVVFLIVLVSRITDTIKKVNAIVDEGTGAAGNAKAKIDQMNTTIKETAGKVSGASKAGFAIVQKLLDRFLR